MPSFPKAFQLKTVLVCCFALLSLANPLAHASLNGSESKNKQSKEFQVPSGLGNNVRFWEKIYSQYTTGQAVIHDNKNLHIIYEAVNVKGIHPSKKGWLIKRAKAKYKKILKKLAGSKRNAKLSKEERRVKNLVQRDFLAARKRIRSQTGQADRFREGIERSGKYIKEMEGIFSKHGLPLELTVLPHVESSFRADAYSRYGAAGVWQFTRSTGRLFMAVNYDIDERRDPLISTTAAARLLKRNYEELGSWPLAVTAYNHGLNGMKRAKARFGKDIKKVIDLYRSRSFGFASRNFYCEFLAALRVVKNKEKHFKKLQIAPPFIYNAVTLGHFYDFRNLASHLGLSPEKLYEFNPSFRQSILNGEKRVPKGFQLKVPKTNGSVYITKVSRIPSQFRFEEQKRSKFYRVKRGDTLNRIAGRFKTSVVKICQRNNIRAKKPIFVGQLLHLPQTPVKGVKVVKVAKPAKVAKIANTVQVEKTAKATKAKTATRPSVMAYKKETEFAFHKVRKGDTVTKIAKAHGVKMGDVLRLNGLRGTSVIIPGTRLRIKVPAAVSRQTLPSKKSQTALPTEKDQLSMASAKEMTEPSAEKKTEGDKQTSSSNIKPDQRPVSLSQIKVYSNNKGRGMIGLITVENNETLGHYSDWADVPISEVRRLNRIRSRKREIKVGEQIKLIFGKTAKQEKFKERRQEYHYSIREDFYSNYEITRTEQVKVKRGQSLWEICQVIYDIPSWLLKDFNPGINVIKLEAGQMLSVPIVNPKESKRPTT